MGTGDSEDKTPSKDTSSGTKDHTETAVTALYEEKVKRMSDMMLISECMIHLKVLESSMLTPEHKYRATILFTEASVRDTLSISRDDFLTALKVLKYL